MSHSGMLMMHIEHAAHPDDIQFPALTQGHNPTSPQIQSHHINPLQSLQLSTPPRVGSYPNRHPTKATT